VQFAICNLHIPMRQVKRTKNRNHFREILKFVDLAQSLFHETFNFRFTVSKLLCDSNDIILSYTWCKKKKRKSVSILIKKFLYLDALAFVIINLFIVRQQLNR